MRKSVIALAVFLLAAGSASAHNGFTQFIPTIPDPTAIVLDGEDDDWGWYDTETFAVLPEEIYAQFPSDEHFEQGLNPAPEDFSASWFTAWSPPPDNSLYLFFRAQDDTLRAIEAKGDWWNDDVLILGMDMDHGGGDFTSEFLNGYRMAVNPLHAKDQGMEGPPYDGSDLSSWPTEAPYGWVSSAVLPAGVTGQLDVNVDYTIELRHHPWAILDQFSVDNSTPHVFEAGQTIHLNITFTDGDRLEHGQQDIWGMDGANVDCGANGDVCHDALIVDTLTDDERANYGVWPGEDGSQTAVENVTWARIKSHTSR